MNSNVETMHIFFTFYENITKEQRHFNNYLTSYQKIKTKDL